MTRWNLRSYAVAIGLYVAFLLYMTQESGDPAFSGTVTAMVLLVVSSVIVSKGPWPVLVATLSPAVFGTMPSYAFMLLAALAAAFVFAKELKGTLLNQYQHAPAVTWLFACFACAPAALASAFWLRAYDLTEWHWYASASSLFLLMFGISWILDRRLAKTAPVLTGPWNQR